MLNSYSAPVRKFYSDEPELLGVGLVGLVCIGLGVMQIRTNVFSLVALYREGKIRLEELFGSIEMVQVMN